MATIIDSGFETLTAQELDAMTPAALDALAFGVVGLDVAHVARIYNATESRMAGIAQERVIGSLFFEAFAQCMNNFMVAQRLEDEPELDDTIPYVLTLRMRPTPVRLRMLACPGARYRYLLIER